MASSTTLYGQTHVLMKLCPFFCSCYCSYITVFVIKESPVLLWEARHKWVDHKCYLLYIRIAIIDSIFVVWRTDISTNDPRPDGGMGNMKVFILAFFFFFFFFFLMSQRSLKHLTKTFERFAFWYLIPGTMYQLWIIHKLEYLNLMYSFKTESTDTSEPCI